MRLIDADAFNYAFLAKEYPISGYDFQETINLYMRCINSQPTIDRWIPCSERLPDDYVEVLTCDKKGNIHTMHHYSKYKCPFNIYPNDERFYQPIAWRNMPEPYRGNRNAKTKER